MAKIKITDAVQGHISLAKNKRNYFKTKDSTSPSGHSLMAQIEMTHAGIVTKNYGFYLPNRMATGAHTFTKDYAKPVIIGHDEDGDTKPVGRVVDAEYVDTSDAYLLQDSYLKQLYQFQDTASKSQKESMLDFVNHVIREYDSQDRYKGMGHLRGTLKITDAEAIEAILDERYLTVSTSMISDSASCSVCGTDWVSEGLCDHNRGQIYDDKVCVVVPGSMSYDHLGIVNTPADPHAHHFSIIGDDPQDNRILQLNNSLEDNYKTNDAYSIAAHLFGCNDNKIVALSTDEDVNLIQVKDSIEKMENAMKKDTQKSIEDRIKDALDVRVAVYRYGSKEEGSKEVTVSEYMEELDVNSMQEMMAQVAKMVKAADSADIKDLEINDAIDRYLDENGFEKVEAEADTETEEGKEEDAAHKGAEGYSKPAKKKKKKKAKVMSDNFKLEDGEEITDEAISTHVEAINALVTEGKIEATDAEIKELAEIHEKITHKDAVAVLTFKKNDSYEELLTRLREVKDSKKLTELDSAEVYEMMKEHILEEKVLDEAGYEALRASDFCGVKGFFPVVDEDHYHAAKAALANISASDSVKGRIISAIEKKAQKLGLDLTDNFDSTEEPCNNNDSISVEELVKVYEDTKAKLLEQGVELPGSEVEHEEKDHEIQILEAQLEAAQEELDSVLDENNLLKTQLVEELATRTVDMKMLSGNFEINDRVEAITEHKSRSADSLRDALKDLKDQVSFNELKTNDGLANDPEGTVEDPTLSQQDSKAGNKDDSALQAEQEKYKIYDEYNKRVTRYGKKEADRWLQKVQKQNGSLQTID